LTVSSFVVVLSACSKRKEIFCVVPLGTNTLLLVLYRLDCYCGGQMWQKSLRWEQVTQHLVKWSTMCIILAVS